MMFAFAGESCGHKSLSLREIFGLLGGISIERFRLKRFESELPVPAAVSLSPTERSSPDRIPEAEEAIRFHLEKTIECIACHKFEGARYHARQEERAREELQRLRELER